MDVSIIAAMSADGFIAKDSSHMSTDWTSQEDYQFFISKVKKSSVAIWGRKTYDTVGRPVGTCLNIIYSRSQSDDAAFDSLTAEDLRSEDKQTKTIFTDRDPTQVIARLEELGVSEASVIGGSAIYHMFMAAGLVTRLFLTIEPIVFGQGVSLFSSSLGGEAGLPLSLQHVHQLSEQTIVLEYSMG